MIRSAHISIAGLEIASIIMGISNQNLACNSTYLFHLAGRRSAKRVMRECQVKIESSVIDESTGFLVVERMQAHSMLHFDSLSNKGVKSRKGH